MLHAYVAAAAALVIFGIPAALQQQRYSPIIKDASRRIHVDWSRVAMVAIILVAAIATNVIVNLWFTHMSDRFPFIGAAVWVAILACVPLAQAGMEPAARGVQGQRVPAVARPVRVDDAGGEAAGGLVADRPRAWASSPPSSTTSRSPRLR